MSDNLAFWFRLSHEAKAALMALWVNSLNGMVVFGLVHLTGEQVATAEAWLSSFVIFVGYISAVHNRDLQARPPNADGNSGSQT